MSWYFIVYFTGHAIMYLGPTPTEAMCNAAIAGYRTEIPADDANQHVSCEYRSKPPVEGEMESVL